MASAPQMFCASCAEDTCRSRKREHTGDVPRIFVHSPGPTTRLQSCRCSYDLRELTVPSGLEEGASGSCRLKKDTAVRSLFVGGGCGIEDHLAHLHDPIYNSTELVSAHSSTYFRTLKGRPLNIFSTRMKHFPRSAETDTKMKIHWPWNGPPRHHSSSRLGT